MARRRGFFAEINYQMQQAEKQRQRQNAAAVRAQAAAQREAERTQRAYERAVAAAHRASAAEKKAAEKEAARLHLEARLAEVEEMNATLAAQYDEIDGILTATLAVDDYVDLASLKITQPDYPPFEPGPLATPTAAVPTPQKWDAPVWTEPAAPSGLGAAFGGKKRHEKTAAEARAAFDKAHAEWRRIDDESTAAYQRNLALRETKETERLQRLAEAEQAHKGVCAAVDTEVAEHNKKLDDLINGLAFDVESAISDYVGIVLSNSVYPESFPVDYDYEFSLESRELALSATVPPPDAVPSVKAYKYVRASDEITSTNLTQKDQKDRYANAVWQVAVRSLHEIFEADRAGKIHSIALTVGTDTISAATGQPTSIPFVLAAADRDTFNSFDLAKVVPKATLEHLGAALSKQPFDLTPANTSRGVRVRAQD